LDASEPPRIVFEDAAGCSDGDRIDDLLRRTLGAARKSTEGWTIYLRIGRKSPHSLRAEGEITEGDGVHVAGRVLYGKGPDCAALARAAGVWGSLVLDAETRRPRTAAAEAQAPVAPVAQPDSTTAEAAPPRAEPALQQPPAPSESPTEHGIRRRAAERAEGLELGLSGFLMTGTGGGAMAGPSPFLYIQAGRGFFLRPSLAVGQTLTTIPSQITGTWIDSRFDACLRLPGNYTTGTLQLDMCGGGDMGLTLLDKGQQLPFVAFGPSLDLRGEVGNGFAVALRGVFGVNLLRQTFREIDDPVAQEVPSWSGRIELAISWSLR
jgi:hypothetical protein